ncbi:MAG TPA: DivIVA domain-containing protein [Candidatus Udaeobacter sp.]|nr:DivIVA domain-containing protein [Candidatus Udaeobacter sp.]
MALTPLDIRKQQFRTVLRGLDPDDVRGFLGLVAAEMEILIRDQAGLREQATALQAKFEEYQLLERDLRDAVLAAQSVREDSRRQAEQESKLLVARAELEIETLKRSGANDVQLLKREIADLRTERQNYLIRLRGLMETHLRMVEAAEVQFAESDHAPNGARATDPSPSPPRVSDTPPSLPEDPSADRTILRTGYAGERTGWRPA